MPLFLPAPFLRFALALAFALVWAGGAFAQIDSVRVVGDGDVTRLTLWSNAPIEADTFLTEAASVRQVLLAVEGVDTAKTGPQQPVTLATGVAGYGWQNGFLAFTLDKPMMVSRKLELPPAGDEPRFRLVIDLAAVSSARFDHAAARAAPSIARHLASLADSPTETLATLDPAPAGRDVVLQPFTARDEYLIVIDPGHGGRDPGAVSSNGLKEKDIVLSAALTLRDMLEETERFRVRMTRSDDRFIELGDRVSLARDWDADLFISIHADAARTPDVAGASVYTISERGQRRIDRESERNNWQLDFEDEVSDEVSGILETLTIRETKSNSGLFAELLLPELAEAGPVLRNTHRKAGFYVLLAPDVPAVLLEMGFLTNPEDADRLADPEGRTKSMDAVADAITLYFDEQDQLFASN
ncbi:MAG: N-acetylmuramoyl-L-alanine amidase [Pseudomonadota bacterium]